MKRILLLIISAMVMVSCGTSKPIKKLTHKSSSSVTGKKYTSSKSGKVSSERLSVVREAEKYLGVPYKYGGNTKSGLDCSGLVVNVFDEHSYRLPRISSEQAEIGDPINISSVKEGDLLFFATAGGRRVSHVGIVSKIDNDGDIKFIHSSTSKGVVISSINETYWKNAFLFARTIL